MGVSIGNEDGCWIFFNPITFFLAENKKIEKRVAFEAQVLLSNLWAYWSGFFGRGDCLKSRFKES